MKVNNKAVLEDQKNTKTIKDHLAKYLANWYIFLIIIGICVCLGFLYARYTIPKYVVSTTVLLKNQSNGASRDLIDEALNGKKEINLNNEMLAISSSALMERVVRKGNFNTCYYKAGNVLNIEIYLDAPFRLLVNDIKDSSLPVTLMLKTLNANGGSGFYGTTEKDKPFSFKWNTPFVTGGKTFALVPNGQVKDGEGDFLVNWRPVSSVASEILSALSISPFDTKTTAIELSSKTENLQKGKDILNTLYTEFNQADIEERSRIAENTLRFIDDRLALMTTDLKGVEGSIENLRGSRGLIDIKEQASISLSNSNDASKNIRGIAVQQRVASMLQDYFQDPANKNKLVPTSLILTDATLSSLISQYNELQLKKEREAPSVAPNSTVMQDLNAQTNNLRNSIVENLNNINKGLAYQEKNFQQQTGSAKQFLSTVPGNERVLQEVKRKQSVTEGLYLYLLQKREEEAISSTSATISNYRQVGMATGYGPVEPNSRNSILIAALLGFVLSIGFVYVKNVLNDKVVEKTDVTGRLNLQIFGYIGNISKKKKAQIDVLANPVISEQFRSLRTNLLFELKNRSTKTVLITSSVENEGKSFVSLNLATVCAATGKRVALLEFDIRKPHLTKRLNINNAKGLTDYLKGDVDELSEIASTLDEVPALHIYSSGPIPVNPADLLLSENIVRLFEALRYQYDYIIVDSPPATLVTDAFVLSEFSDLTLYVIRERKTLKKQLNFLTDIDNNNKLKNIGLVLNDMKSGGEYSHAVYGQHAYTEKSY